MAGKGRQTSATLGAFAFLGAYLPLGIRVVDAIATTAAELRRVVAADLPDQNKLREKANKLLDGRLSMVGAAETAAALMLHDDSKVAPISVQVGEQTPGCQNLVEQLALALFKRAPLSSLLGRGAVVPRERISPAHKRKALRAVANAIEAHPVVVVPTSDAKRLKENLHFSGVKGNV